MSKEYVNFLSWALVLLTCVMDLAPQFMLMNMLIGVMANTVGNKIGHFAGETTANCTTLFFHPGRQAQANEEVHRIEAVQHLQMD